MSETIQPAVPSSTSAQCGRLARFGVVVAVVFAGIGMPSAAVHAADGDGTVRRFMLVIGSNDGGPDRVHLRFAGTDADAFAKVLGQLGGVHGSDRVILKEPTGAQIMDSVAQLKQRIGAAHDAHRRTEFVLYYSGHSDEYGLLLGSERFSYKQLKQLIKEVGADVRIAIVDSCSSGALLRSKGGKRVAPFLIDGSSDVSGHAYLTSSSADEVAQESDRLGASFFTHHLVSGLRGAADVSADGRVTLNEAYQFAFRETLKRTENTKSGPQHANYDIGLSGSGDVVITDLAQLDSILVFDTELAGVFFVRDTSEQLVAEVDKDTSREIALGLEAGRYSVSYVNSGTVFTHDVVLATGGRVALAQSDFQAQRVASAHRERGGKAVAATTATHEHDDGSASVVRLSIVPGVTLFGGRSNDVKGVSIGVLGDHVGRLDGTQVSSLFNIASDSVDGVQVSGLFNVSGGMVDGVQVAGLVNTAGDVHGVQVGLINIGGHVKGAQIGLINYADSVDGVSLGLLPIIADGYNHLQVWYESSSSLHVGYTLGTPSLYILGMAGMMNPSDPECGIRVGGGIGTHAGLGSQLFLDIELVGGTYLADECRRDENNVASDRLAFARLQAKLGYRLTSGMALFVGASAGADFVEEFDERRLDLPGPQHSSSTEAEFVPSLNAGISFF